MKSSGVDPATFRLVAQYLYQLRHRVPPPDNITRCKSRSLTLFKKISQFIELQYILKYYCSWTQPKEITFICVEVFTANKQWIRLSDYTIRNWDFKSVKTLRRASGQTMWHATQCIDCCTKRKLTSALRAVFPLKLMKTFYHNSYLCNKTYAIYVIFFQKNPSWNSLSLKEGNYVISHGSRKYGILPAVDKTEYYMSVNLICAFLFVSLSTRIITFTLRTADLQNDSSVRWTFLRVQYKRRPRVPSVAMNKYTYLLSISTLR